MRMLIQQEIEGRARKAVEDLGLQCHAVAVQMRGLHRCLCEIFYSDPSQPITFTLSTKL